MVRVMGDEDVETKFLVERLGEIIEQLRNDSDQLNWVVRKLSRLNRNLEQLKEALNSGDTKPKKETLYRIKNLLGEWQISSNISSPPFLFNFISQVNALKKEIDSTIPIDSNGQTDQSPETGVVTAATVTDTTTPPEFPKLSTRFPDSINVHGVDDRIRFLVRRLALRRDNDGTEFRAVGISGMGGVGKTMLCQQVFKHEMIQSQSQSRFLPRIWVCASRTKDEEEDYRILIVKRILAALGVEEDVVKYAYEKHSMEGLLFLLRVNLVRKNYFIVLDDVQMVEEEEDDKFFSDLNKDENSREKLAYGLPKGSGGAVMVTSRWEEMVKLMVGSENSQSLTANLDPESCWLIFKDEAEKENNHEISADMKALKDEIIEKCDGLPLAAKMLGKLARDRD